MADFQALAKDLCMADGKIGDAEVRILRRYFAADARIDQKEIQFLVDLRSEGQRRNAATAAFERFFVDALYLGIIGNGIISAKEANFLRKAIFADGKADSNEKALLKRLKAHAKKTDPKFDKLYKEVVG